MSKISEYAVDTAPAGTDHVVTVDNSGTTPVTKKALISDLPIVSGGLLAPSMTTAQRDALTAVNGMIIYSTSNNRLEAYENGSWVDI